MVWGGVGGGLGLTWQVYVIKMLLNSFFKSSYSHKKHILGVKKVVWRGLDVVWGGLEVVWGGLGCFHGPQVSAFT